MVVVSHSLTSLGYMDEYFPVLVDYNKLSSLITFHGNVGCYLPIRQGIASMFCTRGTNVSNFVAVPPSSRRHNQQDLSRSNCCSGCLHEAIFVSQCRHQHLYGQRTYTRAGLETNREKQQFLGGRTIDCVSRHYSVVSTVAQWRSGEVARFELSAKITRVRILCRGVEHFKHCSNSLSCMDEYLAIDNCGYLFTHKLRALIAALAESEIDTVFG